MNSLADIFQAIALAGNEQTLGKEVVPQIGEYFAAKRCKLFLLDRLPPNVPKLFQRALSPEHNPVLSYLIKHHAPIHEDAIVSADKWQAICPRFDHGHVMVGPIAANGSLIGGLGVTRDRLTNAFTERDISDMSGLCLHISTFLVEQKALKFNPSKIELLTSREIEIAQLVAKGLTNAEIGKELWIQENSVKQALKRMFRKLDISSRTSLVSVLLQSTVNSQQIFWQSKK